MEQIIEKILEYVDPDCEVTADSDLKYDCGLSSFDSTAVIGELCRMYGVKAESLNVRAIKTVGDLYNALEAAKSGR